MRPAQRRSNAWLRHVLDRWPGKRLLGNYRFLPVFFVMGAALEFAMIHWHAGQVNFYKTYKRRQAEEWAQQQQRPDH